MGQLHEMIEKSDAIYRIANYDFLDTLAALIPYLIQRREIAKRHNENPREWSYEHMQALNKEIATILSLF